MKTDIDRSPAVHDQVLVEAEVGGKVIGIRAVVVNIMPTALWLGLAQPDPALERLRPDQPLFLTFGLERAAMVGESSFRSHLGASRARLFAIELPDGYRLTQRRAYLRLDAECPIEYTVINQSEVAGAGQKGRGVSANISAGGVKFKVQTEAREAAAVGDQMEVSVELGPSAISSDAEVIRVEETAAHPSGKTWPGSAAEPSPIIAVRFVSISESSQDKIVRYIFRLQRLRRAQARKAAWSDKL
jgi:hypothetical protein